MKDLDKKAYIFGMIFMLSNRLQIAGDKMDPHLTVKQWFFLAGVLKCESDAPTLSEIASQIGSSRQNVKKIASILERQGFVLMEKDKSDARALRIKPTSSCMEHLKKRDGKEIQFLEQLFQGFESKELSLLSEAIGQLEKNLIKMGGSFDKEEE